MGSTKYSSGSSKDAGVVVLNENFRLFELVIITLQVSDPSVNNKNENFIPFLKLLE